MPSLKVLLLSLLLAIIALSAAIFFAKSSKLDQDAQSYAMENPNCREIKMHSNKNDMVECFINFESAKDFPEDPRDADTLYIPMLKLIGEKLPGEFPLRVKHIFSLPSRISDSIIVSGSTINIIKEKNSIWRDTETGCKFPGPCPMMPLKGVMPLKVGVQVNAILPGKILKIENDSPYTVTIYHGENIYTKTSGLKKLSHYAKPGKEISSDSAIGFLPTQDSALTFLEITRNGKQETWESFFKESR
jgi:hypothetical protein